MVEDNIFKYSYNRDKGLRFGFLLQIMFCSNIRDLERRLIYILHVAKLIPDDLIKYHGDKLDRAFLLNFIFQKTQGRKIVPAATVRGLVTLEDRGTFSKYFKSRYEGRRKFTLLEVYEILKEWYGDDFIVVFDSLKKGDLANRFADANYERFEEQITNNGIVDINAYIKQDFIKPKSLLTYIEDVRGFNLEDILSEDEELIEHFDIICFLFLFSMFFKPYSNQSR